MFFFKRNRLLFDKIKEYISISDEAIERFSEAIITFLKDGQNADFDLLMEKCSKLESSADSVLHGIETFLYKKSLLPESREDILLLFEKFDDIIDVTDELLRYIVNRRIIIPDFLKDDFQEMIKTSVQCYENSRDGVRDLLEKRKDLKKYIRVINEYESIVDDIESRMIRSLFSSDSVSDFDKILITDLITLAAKLSDSCENVADSISIINIKRIV